MNNYESARAAMAKYYKLGSLTSEIYYHNSEEFQIKGLAGFVPSESYVGRSIPGLCLGLQMVILTVMWSSP